VRNDLDFILFRFILGALFKKLFQIDWLDKGKHEMCCSRRW